jgi:hypothetical protein
MAQDFGISGPREYCNNPSIPEGIFARIDPKVRIDVSMSVKANMSFLVYWVVAFSNR